MEAFRDIVWRILKQKGIDHKYVPTYWDGMPMPKRELIVPVFDRVTWDQMMQVIAEAGEIHQNGLSKGLKFFDE